MNYLLDLLLRRRIRLAAADAPTVSIFDPLRLMTKIRIQREKKNQQLGEEYEEYENAELNDD